jgi:hypothetical protein
MTNGIRNTALQQLRAQLEAKSEANKQEFLKGQTKRRIERLRRYVAQFKQWTDALDATWGAK